MAPGLSLTLPTALVLRALSAGFRYGFDIMDATGLPSGTVYPLLRRLERLGYLDARWEEASAAHSEARPARRYYRLTGAGVNLLATARQRFPVLERALPMPQNRLAPA